MLYFSFQDLSLYDLEMKETYEFEIICELIEFIRHFYKILSVELYIKKISV